MNPLDLPGPQFLLFYAVVGVVVLLVAEMARQTWESGTPGAGSVSDPYLIAFLRGGQNEAARVAMLSLIDRGLIKVAGSILQTQESRAPDLARRPIEKAILHRFRLPGEVKQLFDDPAIEAACGEYDDTLRRRGLLPDEAARRERNRRLLVMGIVLWGLAIAKIAVAISRGRRNVLFLVLLLLLFTGLAAAASNRFRTARGDRLLVDLRQLFSALRERADLLRPGGATSELALLAAVFGLGVVPAFTFPHARELFARASKSSSWSGGSSCGASCGFSSSCSGGSCGGGGGGCGGCGS